MSDITCCVYRIYNDATDELLYVGMTSVSLKGRIKGHRGSQPWFQGPMSNFAVTHEKHPSGWSALVAEAWAIEAENPRYNKERPDWRVLAEQALQAHVPHHDRPGSCEVCGHPWALHDEMSSQASCWCVYPECRCTAPHNKRAHALKVARLLDEEREWQEHRALRNAELDELAKLVVDYERYAKFCAEYGFEPVASA